MRCYLVFLLLFAVLPAMNALAAPVPAPSAILGMGLSPDPSVPAEQYRKNQREGQTGPIMLARVLSDPEVSKLPSIARMEDPGAWLAENLRVREEKGGRCFRFTFRAGTRAEQVTILNAFLRANVASHVLSIQCGEESLRRLEGYVRDLEERIKSTKNPQEIASYQKGIDELRSVRIPELRAAIARVKEIAVIRWAK